jgi:thymidylate synthase ThyX
MAQESFSERERQLLQPFVTDLESPVFGLVQLPEVVKGALFSRYSRSDKSLRRILLDEFINDPSANFLGMIGTDRSTENIVATQQAEAFYDRVLIGYGDDSVAELGGAHIACEGISNIAAKALEDSRLGISPLEKSTRYVPFDQKIGGRYRYYREPSIMAGKHSDRYERTLDHLFDTYSALIKPLMAWIQTRTPQDPDTTQRAYISATRAKTLDLLRGLLPMATLTNVGLFGNGRALEYLLVKLAASPHEEVRLLGGAMQGELDKIIPSFVKRAKSDRGHQYSDYIATNREKTQILTRDLFQDIKPRSIASVTLIDYDIFAEIQVVTAILYPHTDLPFEEIRTVVQQLSTQSRAEIIAAYVGTRGSRFHRPGRAFEETYYTFDILADIGAYRDLHRHRVLSQERQSYSIEHGYIVPPEIETAGFAQPYREALEKAAQTYQLISQTLPEAAQYIVPLAYRVRWRIKLNLREVYHFVELRSGRQGHPTYRAIAQEIYRQILAIHPTLVASMSFVDLDDYDLERLRAEKRIDEKSKTI